MEMEIAEVIFSKMFYSFVALAVYIHGCYVIPVSISLDLSHTTCGLYEAQAPGVMVASVTSVPALQKSAFAKRTLSN